MIKSPRRPARAIALTRCQDRKRKASIALSALALGIGLIATQVFGESHEETAATGGENIIVSHGFTNFGELKYGPDEPFSYVNLDAPQGGEISLWAQGTFDSFNLYTRKGVPAAQTGLMRESMMIAAADDPYGIYCYLCETIEYPESLDWVVFNLRQDVTYSDGRPMTAEDIKFAIDTYLDQGLLEFRNRIDGFYKSIEVTDTYQIRFEYNDIAPKRDRVALAGTWLPFSPSWFEETGARIDESQSEPFLGTGPYILEEVDFGRRVVYAKDEDWWGADRPVNQGRHNFDRVRVEYFADSAAAFEAFKAGEYTYRVESSSREWATGYNFPAVEDGHVILDTPPDGAVSTAQGFVFNLRKEKWQDPKVREAVSILFNFEWTNETLLYGLYDRPFSFWGGSDLAATGVPEGDERAELEPLVEEGLLDPSILDAEAVMPPVNSIEENSPQRSALRNALRLLTEAGWTAGSDGLLSNEAGEKLDLVIIQTSPTFTRIVNPYVENLRRAGIDAKLERLDPSSYVERRRSGEWDLTNHSPGQDLEPGGVLEQWFASKTAGDSSRNLMALADPAVDRLIERVLAAETLEELVPRTRALDRTLRAYRFWIPQWGNEEHWVAYWDQYGRPETIPPLALGTLDFWWYDEEGAQNLREAGALR